jgi:hypothetical protein
MIIAMTGGDVEATRLIGEGFQERVIVQEHDRI